MSSTSEVPALTDLSNLNNLTNLPQVSGLQVIVKQETPFLPKVAFTLISLASLGGASFTGTLAGLSWFEIVARWVTIWAVGLAGGFAVWRTFYLRDSDPEAAQDAVDALNATALARARLVGRALAPVVLLGLGGALLTPYLAMQPGLQWTLVAALVILASALLVGIDRREASAVAVLTSLAAVGVWAFADTGSTFGWEAWVRVAHLSAFTLWLGGAVWNIWVAMPSGRKHANVDAVVAGAHQLDRFRWVVRFALPTIIVTGLIMAGVYRAFPIEWWVQFPGVLIPLKVGAIIALVVVFIACPLFRHCSPVQGVCNLDDLENQEPAQEGTTGGGH